MPSFGSKLPHQKAEDADEELDVRYGCVMGYFADLWVEALRRRHAGQGLQGLGLQRGFGGGGSAKTAMSLLAGKDTERAEADSERARACALGPLEASP